MPDREKIESLKQCLSASCRGFRTCQYSDTEWDAIETVLELLAEQEPVKPIIENGFSYCGVCGRSLDSDFADEEVFRFCPNCGRKVRQDAAD